jgi:hypothetical protein
MAPDPALLQNRRLGAVPLSYWHDRFLEALAKAERSRDPALQEIYLELADHYRTMDSLIAESEHTRNASGHDCPNDNVPQ